MTTPTYPDITVQLTGTDGNAWVLVGQVAGALKMGGVSREQVSEFCTNAFDAPSYDDLLTYLMETVNVA